MNRMYGMPDAYANVIGSSKYPDVRGNVSFYGVHGGTLVVAEMNGLPQNNYGNFYGFHIHSGSSCSGTPEEPFKNVDGHYSIRKMDHPWHTGDMPNLMANSGMAFMMFYTDRFFPEDIVGKTVIVHHDADDYRSQPSGNPGEMIACGEIRVEY